MEQTKPIGKAGITTDPWRRRSQWERRYPDMTNWREEGPFSKEEGIEWENEQAKLGYETSNGGDDPFNPRAARYGYQFNY